MSSFLPDDIIFILLQYVDYQDQIVFVSSRKLWYQLWMKKYIRKLQLGKGNEKALLERNKENWIRKIKSLILNSFSQLSIAVHDSSLPEFINDLLAEFHFDLYELTCKVPNFGEIMKSVERLRVRKLTLQLSGSSCQGDFLEESFSRISDCQSLSLVNIPATIPHLPSLQRLSLVNSHLDCNIPLITSYSRTLQHLIISHSTITDVSMLGSIPTLELQYCNQLVDITSLNNNDHVLIWYCDLIDDYSHSFANSRKIEITLSRLSDRVFDLSRWSKIEDLNLTEIGRSRATSEEEKHRLPKTVKRCTLAGGFVSAVDFTVTRDHSQMTEIHLSNDRSIWTLQDYGLDQVTIISCTEMGSLYSLQGLGSGKNRKVMISYCDNIRDFSPLRKTPIVEITRCDGFQDPSQLSSVTSLTVSLSSDISFQVNSLSVCLFERIQFLSITGGNHMIKGFDGLETIPHLELRDFYGYPLIKNFVEKGGKLQNRTIVLHDFCFYPKVELLGFYNTYLQNDYDCLLPLPRKCIWYRK